MTKNPDKQTESAARRQQSQDPASPALPRQRSDLQTAPSPQLSLPPVRDALPAPPRELDSIGESKAEGVATRQREKQPQRSPLGLGQGLESLPETNEGRGAARSLADRLDGARSDRSSPGGSIEGGHGAGFGRLGRGEEARRGVRLQGHAGSGSAEDGGLPLSGSPIPTGVAVSSSDATAIGAPGGPSTGGSGSWAAGEHAQPLDGAGGSAAGAAPGGQDAGRGLSLSLRRQARVAGESIPALEPSKDLGPTMRRLADLAHIQVIKDAEAAQVALEVRHQELQLGARQLRGVVAAGLPLERQTLAQAVREDEWLSTLPAKQVLQELAGAGVRPGGVSPARAGGGGAGSSGGPGGGVSGGGISLDSFVAAAKRAAQHKVSAPDPPPGTLAAAAPAAAGISNEATSGAASDGEGSRFGAPAGSAAELLAALRARWEHPDESAGGAEGEDGDGGPGLASAAPAVTLDDLVSALRHELPAQAGALTDLKAKRELLGLKLGWARRRHLVNDQADVYDERSALEQPQHHQSAPWASPPRRVHLRLDDRARELRAVAESILDELLDAALRRVAQRPSRPQVAAEVAAWRAARPGAVAGVARQLLEGLVHEVVDEMVAQVHLETCHLKQVADSFAFDLLVEAVAFSQRKYEFGPGADNVRARLRDAAVEQEANLARSIAARRAAQLSRAASRKQKQQPQRQHGAPAGAGRGASGRGRQRGRSGGGGMSSPGGGWGDGEEDEGDVAGAQLAVRGHHSVAAAATRGIKVGAQLDEELDEEAIYVLHRDFDDTAPPATRPGQRQQGQGQQAAAWSSRARDEKQLYLEGLKAILQEMRQRRGEAPYGHTQQLSVYWPPYVRVTVAQRLATQRLAPPLAAGAFVWRQLAASRPGGPVGRSQPAHWPGPACEAAAARERQFWSQVALRPSYLTARNAPMVQVFKELGPITATSASPNGAFLALGTAPGVMMVFDMRGKPVAPWFQVMGDGHTYKRPPWFRRRRKPRNPAIVAFAWSADSYQLAALDASSTIRLWWMRPETGATIKEDPGRQPVAPELAISLGPLSVALTGKAPVLEPLWEEAVAAAAAAAAAGGVPPASQAAALAAAAAAAALSRRWSVCFHPSFNIAGVQPVVLLPQVTGDLVKLTTTLGSGILPSPLPVSRNRPRPLLSQKTVDYLMPPQLRSPESRTQSILRGHDAHVVFVGVLADCATVVSVDMRGAVHLWPTYEGDRSGYGWFRPRRSWQMPRTLRSFQARGPLHPVWPRVPVPALRGIIYNPPPQQLPTHVAGPGREGGAGGSAAGAGGSGGSGGGGGFGGLRNLLFFRRRRQSEGAAGGDGGGGWMDGMPLAPTFSAPSAPAATFADLLEDAGMLDGDGEAARLDELPLGDFLLESRRLWMVRFLVDRNGRLLREAIHRPTSPQEQQQQPGGGAGPRSVLPLVVSTTTMSGELVRRAKQYVVHTQLPYRVVAADLTPSRRDLVVWCHVAPQPADTDSFGYFSVHVLSVEEDFQPATPRIEIYDHSRGAAPPAFAVSPRVPGLGSEYLVVGLAHGLLGFFSLGTGAVVRVVQLPGVPLQSRYFTCLSLYTVSPSLDCPNAGKSFVAATAAGSTATHIYHLDDEEGTQLNVGLLAGLTPPPGAAPPLPPQPIIPTSREPAPTTTAATAAGRTVPVARAAPAAPRAVPAASAAPAAAPPLPPPAAPQWTAVPQAASPGPPAAAEGPRGQRPVGEAPEGGGEGRGTEVAGASGAWRGPPALVVPPRPLPPVESGMTQHSPRPPSGQATRSPRMGVGFSGGGQAGGDGEP